MLMPNYIHNKTSKSKYIIIYFLKSQEINSEKLDVIRLNMERRTLSRPLSLFILVIDNAEDTAECHSHGENFPVVKQRCV